MKVCVEGTQARVNINTVRTEGGRVTLWTVRAFVSTHTDNFPSAEAVTSGGDNH